MTLNSPEPQRPIARRLALAALAVLLAAGSHPALAPGAALGASLASDYWRAPLAPQGEAPPHWTETEQSLAPEACAECHADQYREWRTSFHAGAFSPGLVGQLLSFNAEGAASCMKCHAPLAEQRTAFEAARRSGNAHTAAGQGLAAAGNSCAGCHVRARRYHGPPERDTGAVGPGNAEAPHGGVLSTADFERSGFCSACHQFPPSFAVNGKPLENTYEEWRASPRQPRASPVRAVTCPIASTCGAASTIPRSRPRA